MTDLDVPSNEGQTTETTAIGIDSEGQSERTYASTLPYAPPPAIVFRTLLVVGWVGVAYVLLHRSSGLLLDYWFLESLGLEGVFWTNVRAGATLFAVAGLSFAAAVYLPLRAYAVTPIVRRLGTHVAALTGLVAGWSLAGHYQEYLIAFSGSSFGVSDPVFSHDVGLYVFVFPALWTTLWAITNLVIVGLLASVVGQADRLTASGELWEESTVIPERVGRLATPAVQGFAAVLGVVLSVEVFLSRYEILWKDNSESGVRMGVEYLDVVPFFSTVNAIQVTTLVILGITAIAVHRLHRMHDSYSLEGGRGRRSAAADGGEDHVDRDVSDSRIDLRRATVVAVASLIVLDLVFFAGVVATDEIVVQPNEPRIQEPFIRDHMDATLAGYGLNEVDVVEWESPESPLEPETMLASNTVQQAPIWPGWVSYLEAPVDLQHVERLQKTDTTMVYGPVLEIYRQEQQLRPYYDFASVDTVRYTVDGEKRIYTSSVRELPSVDAVGPQVWLNHWATNRFLYTHGYGMVMSPANELRSNGNVEYAVEGLPPRSAYPELEGEPRIYYGEMFRGEDRETYFNYVFTNARDLPEFDFPEAQSSHEFRYTEDAGVPVDSVLKRAVLGVVTGDWQILFTDYVDPESTHVHYYREPIERINRIAPYLFVDSNPYAVVAEGRTTWMVNALTTTDRYPNSFREELGDKAEERGVDDFPTRTVNYAEDSMKITVDATTGEITFYKVADDPIVNAWADVYPELFTPKSEMPATIEAHLQYPLQWMHLQLDDIYKRYHQRNLLEFFNNEDLWDDADEVQGSIIGSRDEIVFSYEPMDLLLDSSDLPGDVEPPSEDVQFVKVMPFTPENARNLRSLMIVYQDPESYGNIVSVRIPPSELVHGPEQADALLDEDPAVTEHLGWWMRQGAEVIRGHTIVIPVGGDFLYLEPVFVKSQQNEMPQIKLFGAVYRGEVAYAETPDGAIQALGEKLPSGNQSAEVSNVTRDLVDATTASGGEFSE